MLKIYLKTTTEKKWHTQNFDFESLKSSSPGQFLGTVLKVLQKTFKHTCWEVLL